MTGSSKTITVKNSTNADKITVKVNGDSKDIEKNKTADFTYTRHSSSGSSTTTYTVTVGSVKQRYCYIKPQVLAMRAALLLRLQLNRLTVTLLRLLQLRTLRAMLP